MMAPLSNDGYVIFQDLSVPKASGNHFSNQISNVSLLARHNFQRLSPQKRLGNTSYPVCWQTKCLFLSGRCSSCQTLDNTKHDFPFS